MECQLADGTESLIGAQLGGCDSVVRSDALMKVNRADQLREEHQHSAHRRNRARRAPAFLVKPG
jgi:hypothetical protein